MGARSSGIATYYVGAMPWALDEDGQPIVGTLATGLVQVTRDAHPLPADAEFPEPRHVFEVQPGLEPDQLPGSPASVDVIGSHWTVEALLALYPVQAPYCLDAEWEVTDPETGETVLRRGRMVELPDGVTPLRTNIPSHCWAGDGD